MLYIRLQVSRLQLFQRIELINSKQVFCVELLKQAKSNNETFKTILKRQSTFQAAKKELSTKSAKGTFKKVKWSP